MYQKWKIVLSICLVIAVCLPLVSAAVPITKHYFPRSSITQSSSIKTIPGTFDNTKIIPDPFAKKTTNPLEDIEKPNLTINSFAFTKPGISRPSISFPRITDADSDIYISKNQAIEIALGLFPGICLIEPIGADFRRIDAPAYPLAKNPCWVVDMIGYNPEGEPCCNGCIIEGNVIPAYLPYGGHIIIDAVTGEILYVDYIN